MIRQGALAAAVAILPAFASAQTVVARSGEHDGFSRIVLQMPLGAEWSLERQARSARLTVDRDGLRFDTSRVFERIPRTRLTALEQAEPGGPLVFSLGCDCDIAEFVQSDRYLVIDIADAGPVQPALSTAEPPAPPATPLTLPILSEPSLANLPAAAPTPNDPPSGLASKPTGSTGLNRSEARLLEQIDRALDQGLLEPHHRSADAQSANGSGTRVARFDEPQSERIGLSVRNAIDEGMARASGNDLPAADTPACLPDALVAIQDWGTERPFPAQLGDLRGLLYGEFDRVNPEAVLGLARLYLYFGFGAEAAGILDLGRQNDLETRVIEAIANVMDDKEPREPNPLAGQQACDGDAALWSVLTAGSVVRPFNSEAVLLAFARLPAHLKSHLGPVLVRRFSDADERDMASAILIATTRSGDPDDPDLVFAEASLERSRGNLEAWSGGMSEVIDTGSEHAPQALVELIEATWQSRGAIAPDVPDLLDSFLLENRNTELGPDLRRAKVLALSLSGDFAAANDRLAAILEADGAEAQLRARLPFLALLHERGSDLDFLQYTLASAARETLPGDLGTALAERVLELGFAEAAMDLLQEDAGEPLDRERRVLRARAALARDLPNRALVELLSLTGADADRLRAEAMVRTGNPEQAVQALLMTGAQEDAARELWLSGAGQVAPGLEATRYGQALAIAAELAPPAETDPTAAVEGDPPPDTPLGDARELLAQSALTRNRIADLMTIVDGATAAD